MGSETHEIPLGKPDSTKEGLRVGFKNANIKVGRRRRRKEEE